MYTYRLLTGELKLPIRREGASGGQDFQPSEVLCFAVWWHFSCCVLMLLWYLLH